MLFSQAPRRWPKKKRQGYKRASHQEAGPQVGTDPRIRQVKKKNRFHLSVCLELAPCTTMSTTVPCAGTLDLYLGHLFYLVVIFFVFMVGG